MTLTYKETRTISTGNYENIKIELEYPILDSTEGEDTNSIDHVRRLLDIREYEIRTHQGAPQEKPKSAELSRLSRVISEWVTEKGQLEISQRREKAIEILDEFNAQYLSQLPEEKYEEFLTKLMDS